MSSDELVSGGGDGGWRGGANKSKRQKVPGRGPGVAQLEKIMRLGDDCSIKPQDTTSNCAFTFPSHYAPPFLLAPPPPPPPHPPVMAVNLFGPPPHPMPRGFFSDDKSEQILAHPQYSPTQPLTPMMNPPFWKIVQSSPSSNGQITVEPPSNQRFNQNTNSALLQPHQGPFVCNHQHPDPFSDHTTTNTCLHEINPRETKRNMVKWGVSECGSSFQGRTSNESGEERSRGRHVVPFYNFIQLPNEYLKEKDDEEGGNIDLDLDLKL